MMTVFSKITGEGLTGYQGNQRWEMGWWRIVFRVAVLVAPPQVIAEHVVQEALPGGEAGPQLPIQGFLVFVMLGRSGNGFTL